MSTLGADATLDQMYSLVSYSATLCAFATARTRQQLEMHKRLLYRFLMLV